MITVKDIREKEFAVQKHGYHEDEVDEFLDEIADQMEALIRENRAMAQDLEEAKAAQARAESALAEARRPAREVPVDEPGQPAVPDDIKVNDSSYFKNLEAALREALLSAQRIADQTVQEASQKAEKVVSDAEQQATRLRADAKREADALMGNLGKEAEQAKTQLESLKKSIDEHRARFLEMLEEQMKLLKPEDK